MTECLFEQLLHRFKRKVGWRRDGQAKFEAQEAQKSRSNDSCRKLAECGLTENACIATIASTVLHGNSAGSCTHYTKRGRKSSFDRRRPSLFWKKIPPETSDGFETWQEYFRNIDASLKRKKED